MTVIGLPDLVASPEDAELDALAEAGFELTSGRTAEVIVTGKPAEIAAQLSKPCRHGAAVFVQSVVGLIHETTDPTTPMVAWQLKIKAQCGECGAQFSIDPAGETREDGRAVVFALTPND